MKTYYSKKLGRKVTVPGSTKSRTEIEKEKVMRELLGDFAVKTTIDIAIELEADKDGLTTDEALAASKATKKDLGHKIHAHLADHIAKVKILMDEIGDDVEAWTKLV